MIKCKYDDVVVVRKDDGTWICKSWAMRGPTGSMMNKVIEAKYSSDIEDDYQNAITFGLSHYGRLSIIGAYKEEPLAEEAGHDECNVSSYNLKDIKDKIKNKKIKKKVRNEEFINPFK